jgi:TPR repeat protein
MGLCYSTGAGVAKDEREAIKSFRLAADQFALAAAKVNGLRHILSSAFPAAADFDRSLLRHLGVDTAKAGASSLFILI